MSSVTARAAFTPEDEALLASVRKALADIWSDSVFVRHVAMSRRTARAIERDLSRQKLSFKRALPRRAGLGTPLSLAEPQPHTAPRSSNQPTLASGCDGHPAASDKRRGDKRFMRITLRKDGNGETFFKHHGDFNAR